MFIVILIIIGIIIFFFIAGSNDTKTNYSNYSVTNRGRGRLDEIWLSPFGCFKMNRGELEYTGWVTAIVGGSDWFWVNELATGLGPGDLVDDKAYISTRVGRPNKEKMIMLMDGITQEFERQYRNFKEKAYTEKGQEFNFFIGGIIREESAHELYWDMMKEIGKGLKAKGQGRTLSIFHHEMSHWQEVKLRGDGMRRRSVVYVPKYVTQE